MQPMHDETYATNNEQQTPGNGPAAKKARPGAVIPTALVGPAQQGHEPCPILLPHITSGASVAPNVPALPAALLAEHQATLVLDPMTSEEQGEATGAQEQQPTAKEEVKEPIAPPPPVVPGQEQGYPVITGPLPAPGNLSHTSPFPSAPVQHQPPQWSPRRRMFFLAGLGSGLLLYILALVLLAVFVAPVATLAATVTLVPKPKPLSTTLTVMALATGTPEQANKQVTARLLSVSSPAQSQRVPTTGIGHAPARVGEGALTFYNAAPYSQTVAAGTLLTGNDGVEIVTDAPAFIPAGNPPLESEATVPAHATKVGPQGNIAPLDLNGLCCMAGISVKNTTAFHGGQYAYDYPMVTQQDIDHAAGPPVATLTPQIQASLQAEMHHNERLAGQVVCQSAVIPNRPVGSAASQVTVSVSVTCHAEAYDYEAVVRLVTNALMLQATTTLGTGYVQRGTISTIITPAGAPPHAKRGTLTLLVTGQGIWVYQVRMTEQARLTKLIASLSRQQATHVLQQQEPGHFAAVHIQITGLWTDGNRLPADPARIHLLIAMGA